jgi:hypothetical protein
MQIFIVFIRDVHSYFNSKSIQFDKVNLFWIFCEALKINCRKVHFFDLAENVEETFYNLKYSSNTVNKKYKKGTK